MSEFARTLQAMMDIPMPNGSELTYTRSDWRFILSCGTITEVEIEGWLKDENVPKSFHLNMIFLCAESYHSLEHPMVTDFIAMAHKPALEISPFGKRMLPTVWEYMKRPLFSDLSNKLAKLTVEGQEELLASIYLS